MPLDKWYPTCCPHFLPRGKEKAGDVEWPHEREFCCTRPTDESTRWLVQQVTNAQAHNTQQRMAPEDLHISGDTRSQILVSTIICTVHVVADPSLQSSELQSLSRRAVRQTAKPTRLNPIGTYSRTGVRGRLNHIVQKMDLLYKDPICT